jgi:predicted RNase H-like nuclease (RuvC/YqgF family)
MAMTQQLKRKCESLSTENNSLKATVEQLTASLAKKSRDLEVLARNISCLYKTAKAEIDRKDQMIRDLRAKSEDNDAKRRKK